MVWSALGSLLPGQAAALGGGLSLLGSLGSARMSQSSANKQMQFQASQTGTGYQRAVDDMRKAGLNPMLAAKLGPAASGSGAMAQIPDFGQAISRGAQSAQALSSAKQAEASVGKINQEIKNLGLDEIAKGLDNESKTLLVDFEKRLSKEAYKLYRMPILKALGEALQVPGVVAEFTESEVGSAARGVVSAAMNPVKTIENAFEWAVKNGKELAEKYGTNGFDSILRAFKDYVRGK